MKKIKNHEFNGVPYDIKWVHEKNYYYGKEKVLGLCDDPKEDFPEIIINTHQTPKQVFRTCLHEALHAQFFKKLSEKEVLQADEDIGEFLWRIFKKNLK